MDAAQNSTDAQIFIELGHPPLELACCLISSDRTQGHLVKVQGTALDVRVHSTTGTSYSHAARRQSFTFASLVFTSKKFLRMEITTAWSCCPKRVLLLNHLGCSYGFEHRRPGLSIYMKSPMYLHCEHLYAGGAIPPFIHVLEPIFKSGEDDKLLASPNNGSSLQILSASSQLCTHPFTQ